MTFVSRDDPRLAALYPGELERVVVYLWHYEMARRARKRGERWGHLARRKALHGWLVAQRKAVWLAGQATGWGRHARRRRYHVLWHVTTAQLVPALPEPAIDRGPDVPGPPFYAGSVDVVQSSEHIFRRYGLSRTSAKRGTIAGSGAGSAHHRSQLRAYAEDWSDAYGRPDDPRVETPAMWAAFAAACRFYGITPVKNSYLAERVVTVRGVRYRVRLIYGADVAHANHVHIEAWRV